MRPGVARIFAFAALSAALGTAACRDDEAGGDAPAPPEQARSETTETSPAAARALKDTSSRPQVPQPAGSPPRRLLKEDVVKGKGRPANAGDSVVVHYVGARFSTGQEFGASWDRGEPFAFVLGGRQVIEGWDRGIVGMREGGRRQLTIPPELGYGAEGSAPDVPPHETLIYVIDLIEIR